MDKKQQLEGTLAVIEKLEALESRLDYLEDKMAMILENLMDEPVRTYELVIKGGLLKDLEEELQDILTQVKEDQEAQDHQATGSRLTPV